MERNRKALLALLLAPYLIIAIIWLTSYFHLWRYIHHDVGYISIVWLVFGIPAVGLCFVTQFIVGLAAKGHSKFITKLLFFSGALGALTMFSMRIYFMFNVRM